MPAKPHAIENSEKKIKDLHIMQSDYAVHKILVKFHCLSSSWDQQPMQPHSAH